MAIMMGKLYTALRSANVPDREAIEAAEEVAVYDNRLSLFELRLTKIEGSLNLLRWMVGFNLAMTVAVLFKLFIH
jgi:hypothetical protein